MIEENYQKIHSTKISTGIKKIQLFDIEYRTKTYIGAYFDTRGGGNLMRLLDLELELGAIRISPLFVLTPKFS